MIIQLLPIPRFQERILLPHSISSRGPIKTQEMQEKYLQWVVLALNYQITVDSTNTLTSSGCLLVIKEVFSHHILWLHHLDRSILLLDGLVGTPGKT